MSNAHSKWSASGFEQRMLCPGSHVLQAGKPDNSSSFAEWGTDAHDLAAECLQSGTNAKDHAGRVMPLGNAVDADMIDCVDTYVSYVRDVVGDDGVLLVEQRVNYADYLGVPEADAWGTADAIVFKGDEIVVIDLKTGRGVEVSAERNPQMSLYALGALAGYNGLAGEFTRVRMAISQPRLTIKPSEFDLSVDELEAWGRGAARSAVASCMNADVIRSPDQGGMAATEWQDTFLRPGEKQCKFCKAKATCPALRDEVISTVFVTTPATPDEFATYDMAFDAKAVDQQWLAVYMDKADLIDDWLKAVRAEVERRLLAGDKVPGYKVVQGKKGARQWADAEAAEKLLRETFRLKVEEAYDLKLISPTSAEKLHKAGAIGPRQWPKAQALITQREGAPHVAPESDPRPALDVRPVRDDFQNLADDLA